MTHIECAQRRWRTSSPRRPVPLKWLAAIAAAGAVSAAAPANAAAPPNIVFVLNDDWGWGDLGAFHSITGGDPGVMNTPRTPRLDRMAAEGTLFTDFHTMGAECSPSRASFMTGRSPSDKKVRVHLVIGAHDMNAAKGCADFLDPVTATATSVLKHHGGYATAHFGKWHLGSYGGNASAGLPGAPSLHAYGIDQAVSYGSNPAVNDLFPVARNASNPFADPWFPSNSSRQIVDYGIAFMKNASASKTPFYLNLWLHVSHAPLWPTDEQLAKYPTSDCPGPNPGGRSQRCAVQVYRASQHDADAQVGRLLDWLDGAPGGLGQNTLVVWSTDNGPEDPHIDQHAVGDPGPFRGRKRSLYEGGVRVPFIARWPGRVPAGVVSAADIASVDWLPTVAALAGVAPTGGGGWSDGLMGRDASALLLGTAASVPRPTPKMFDYRFDNTRQGYCYHGAPRLAIRQGPLKLLTNTNPAYPRTELYNLSASLFEATNLLTNAAPGGDIAQLADKMRATLLAWEKTLDPINANMDRNQHRGCAEYTFPTGAFAAPVDDGAAQDFPRDPWD